MAALPVKIARKSVSSNGSTSPPSSSLSAVSNDCFLDWHLGLDLYTATQHTCFLPGNTFTFPTMSSQVSVKRKDAFGSMTKTKWKLSYDLTWFHTQKTHVVKIQIDRALSTFQGDATLTASVQKGSLLLPFDWVEGYIQDMFMDNLQRRTESFPAEVTDSSTTMGWELHFPTSFGLEPLSPESMSSIVLKMEFEVSLLPPQGETTMELLADLDLAGTSREDLLARLLEEERSRGDRLENTVSDLLQRIVDLEQGPMIAFNNPGLPGGGYAVQNAGYKCGYCSVPLPSYEALQVHEAKVRLDNGHFLCCYCPKQFISKKTLKAHQPEHHEELKHACGLCGRKYYRAAKLKEHCRKMHNGVGWRRFEDDMEDDEDSSEIMILDIIGDI